VKSILGRNSGSSALGEPEKIARSVVFLAADDAGFITVSTLTGTRANTWCDAQLNRRAS